MHAQALPVPLIDARSDPLATADPAAVRALRDTIFGSYRSLILPALPVADRIAHRWLTRSPSPYVAELDAIATHTGVSGIYAINISYEYACTALARSDAPGAAPTLRRTLDWPFLGLGRSAILAHRSGRAGEFVDVTWPGAVGTLTALAPGRFAAAINQAPLRRRTRTDMFRGIDYTRNLAWTLSRERGMPPLHLLRYAFETATDFSEALQLLRTVELARPVLVTLVGCAADEIAIVERRERSGTVYLGPGAVANDWRESQYGWEPRPCALPDRRRDSVTRCATIEQAVTSGSTPFSWVIPPVRNWNTRLAVEMNAGRLDPSAWIRAA
ncbi:hypothetical protein [Microvirga sp. VF16]|uniref:hypothetical protein n=1 Tax=Microvirga sp. VF16 TaxID=2807101 RepID=UPI00193C888B|nr:hypothetical protein [Microvirga sp. VF16]QRM36118.1 hypothetical protein JO965_46045 [Microvirga sp. VF16]